MIKRTAVSLIEPVRNFIHFPPVKFILLFAAIFAFVFLILSPLRFQHELAAQSSQLVLTSLGKQSTLSHENGLPYLQLDNVLVEISDLCAGTIELAVLAGIVFATHERSLRKRAKGFAAGVLLFAFFNPLRIALTVNAFGTPLFDTMHEVLFRAILIVGIVTFYAVWYNLGD